MKEIAEYLQYQPDTGEVIWRKSPANHVEAGDIAGTVGRGGYIGIIFKGKRLAAHRVAFFLMKGFWPETVDHINGNPKDNRWRNLRSVSHSENHRNRKMQTNNTSGVAGVSWRKQSKHWQAKITILGKQIFLGQYKEKADAIRARKEAEQKYGFHKNHGIKRASSG